MKNRNIVIIVAVTALILSVPLIAMQFDNGVDWNLFDFVVIGFLLLGTGFTYELLSKKVVDSTQRALLALVLAFALFIVWADLAVGIFNIPGVSGS